MDGPSRFTVGVASDYIEHFNDYQRARRPVDLYVRESSRKQRYRGNVAEAVADALRQLTARGITPLATFAGVESSHIQEDRPLLEAAIAHARAHGAVLVAPSRCRFIRAREYGPGATQRCEPPSVAEYRMLARMAAGVALATLLHPDAPTARPEQTARGIHAKRLERQWQGTLEWYEEGRDQPGHKARWREVSQTKVRWLMFFGFSVRAIAKMTGVPRETILRWMQQPD